MMTNSKITLVATITIFIIFLVVLPLFLSGLFIFFFKNDNNKPELDNLSSTVLVFLKLLFFPTSFLSATEKLNNKNLVHFNILSQFTF